MSRPTVAAVGGERTVPAPDDLARDYLLLALRLDQRIPGLVDGYYGPAELKGTVDLEQRRVPGRLREDARLLLERVDDEAGDSTRARWLTVQLDALEGHAARLAGEVVPYSEFVARCFDWMPERVPEETFAEAEGELDRLLPGDGPLVDRIGEWDDRFVIGPDRLDPVLEWLAARYRDRAAALFGLPEGERVRIATVTGQPWTGYNWYDGGLRSRVDVNTDLPVRAADLLTMLPHETYPGHHLEHAWKEALLVDGAGWLEHSAMLINAPECLISEGLADLGRAFAVPDDQEVDLLVELYERAGLSVAADASAARQAADTQRGITRALRAVRAVPGNAALMLHADGAGRDTVLAYLRRWMLVTPGRAAKRLEFIEHPLWRTYVFVYFEGERLLRSWLDVEGASEAARVRRFSRLLREPLTPSAVAAEAQALTAELGEA